METTEATGPLPGGGRIEMLDALRGLAVLGILVTNIQHFAMFAGTTRDPTLYGDLHGANFLVFSLTFLLVYQKFLPVFSMLFGAGILLQATRREAAGSSAVGLHYRRMATLLAIGLIHSYLIWYGDILFTYALCGMAVFPLRKRSPRLLLSLGLLVLAVPMALRFFLFILPALLNGDPAPGGPAVEEIVADDLAAFRGDWLDAFRMRLRYTFESQTLGLALILFWRAAGLMLLGMGLFKLGVLTGKRSQGFYGALVAIAFLGALPVTGFGLAVNTLTDWSNFLLRGLAHQIIYWVGIVMSLGWIGLLTLVWRVGRGAWLGRRLAAVGRMALTNYLMQSVLCTFIFYGQGLGLYGAVERTGQFAVVVGVWALQLVLSPLWLRRFRFGPVEWAWRSVAYGTVQPLVAESVPDRSQNV